MGRRLTAIFAADVVGFTRLMGADEVGTLARLKALRRDLVQPQISKRDGRIVKLMGDGLLAEFPSVVEAVQCAIDVRSDLKQYEAELPEDQLIRLRIGVNLGDVIVEGSDIYGDGVNVAARLEALAAPGSICISGAVMEQIKGRPDQSFFDRGEQRVKNVDQPIRVFSWPADGDAPRDTPYLAKGVSNRPSIAVLPFQNMSAGEGDSAFVEGLTEDIITALSKMRWYDVKARSSTFAYEKPSRDVSNIGRELHASYVLEGSVRRGQDRFRISAQLVETETGNHVWSDRFDRDAGDEFTVQDEIAQRVSSILGERIWQNVARHIAHKSEQEFTAFDYAFSAIEMLHRLDPASISEASQRLLKALELNPDLYTCRIGLGFCCLVRGIYFGVEADQAIEEAHGHALKLLKLAPDDAQTFDF